MLFRLICLSTVTPKWEGCFLSPSGHNFLQTWFESQHLTVRDRYQFMDLINRCKLCSSNMLNPRTTPLISQLTWPIPMRIYSAIRLLSCSTCKGCDAVVGACLAMALATGYTTSLSAYNSQVDTLSTCFWTHWRSRNDCQNTIVGFNCTLFLLQRPPYDASISQFLFFVAACLFERTSRAGFSWCQALIRLWGPSPRCYELGKTEKRSICAKPKITVWMLSKYAQ